MVPRFLGERVRLRVIAGQRFDGATHEPSRGEQLVVGLGDRFAFQAFRECLRVGIPAGGDQRLSVKRVDESPFGRVRAIGLVGQRDELDDRALGKRVQEGLDLPSPRADVLCRCSPRCAEKGGQHEPGDNRRDAANRFADRHGPRGG